MPNWFPPVRGLRVPGASFCFCLPSPLCFCISSPELWYVPGKQMCPAVPESVLILWKAAFPGPRHGKGGECPPIKVKENFGILAQGFLLSLLSVSPTPTCPCHCHAWFPLCRQGWAHLILVVTGERSTGQGTAQPAASGFCKDKFYNDKFQLQTLGCHSGSC